MAKTKKNRAGLSERIAKKANKSSSAKLNPFDIRFIKSKQKVLGRKEKNDVGKPGVARAKAIQKVKIHDLHFIEFETILSFIEERDAASGIQTQEQEQSVPGQENWRERWKLNSRGQDDCKIHC